MLRRWAPIARTGSREGSRRGRVPRRHNDIARHRNPDHTDDLIRNWSKQWIEATGAITIALIYKFMDDMEAEELDGNRKFFAGEYGRYGCRWSTSTFMASPTRTFAYDTLTSQNRWNEYADVILAQPALHVAEMRHQTAQPIFGAEQTQRGAVRGLHGLCDEYKTDGTSCDA